MGAIAGQNCGLKSGWTDKADGWGADVNTDLLIADIFMQPTVIAITQAPRALGRGSAYIVAAGAASLATKTNHIAIYTGSGWVYIPPRIGWTFYVSDDDKYYLWTGSAWEEVLTGVKIASTTAAGLVKPDGVTTVTDSAGTLTAKDIAIGGSLTDTASTRGLMGNAKYLNGMTFDIDTLFTQGIYRIYRTAGTSPGTYPFTTNENCYMIVFNQSDSNLIAQCLICTSQKIGSTYYRSKANIDSEWSSWNRIVEPMTGATASAAGTAGLVPAPAAGMQNALLGGDAVYHPLSNSVTSTSQTNAASSLAVKTVYDKAATMPVQTSNNVAGKWDTIGAAGTSQTLPSGGTYAYFLLSCNSSNGVINQYVGVTPGGSTLTAGDASFIRGFYWRIA